MKTDLHVMLDLETLSLKNNPLILSIGAVYFDKHTVHRERGFYCTIELNSYRTFSGFDMDPGTLAWWLQQSPEALREFTKITSHHFGIKQAIMALEHWLGEKDWKGLWSCGATADIVWIRNAFENVGLKVPWSYKRERCFRTLFNLFPDIKPRDTVGTAHKAIDDAINQASQASAILNYIEYMKGYEEIEKDTANNNPMVDLY